MTSLLNPHNFTRNALSLIRKFVPLLYHPDITLLINKIYVGSSSVISQDRLYPSTRLMNLPTTILPYRQDDISFLPASLQP